ncbi:DedA family protein [Streptomyces sudanensis]|uniref:DedA family protein n=1 Tax=Streptomyces sudanensis TaxID=436397 RepID=UPI0020CF577F|nr:VTT domain-containing protein [Streptomyces sudanensis]MCP9956546.1 VTT domain-containing protein [Streptomyces sudanensis]
MIGELLGQEAQRAVGYPSLFLLVALGALVPVVPTGAVVSSAAVVAFHQAAPFALVAVFLVAAAAALAGDAALYWLGWRGVTSPSGPRWPAALAARAAPDRLERARAELRRHRVPVLVVSRLVPAGRVPVMVACLLTRMPPARFVRGDVPAVLAWTAAYQLIGVAGGALFPRPWQGVAAAVALALLVSAAPGAWRWAHRGRRPDADG